MGIAACSLYPTTPHSFSLYTTSIASLSFPGVLSFHLFLFLDVCEVFDKRSWDGGVSVARNGSLCLCERRLRILPLREEHRCRHPRRGKISRKQKLHKSSRNCQGTSRRMFFSTPCSA